METWNGNSHLSQPPRWQALYLTDNPEADTIPIPLTEEKTRGRKGYLIQGTVLIRWDSGEVPQSPVSQEHSGPEPPSPAPRTAGTPAFTHAGLTDLRAEGREGLGQAERQTRRSAVRREPVSAESS